MLVFLTAIAGFVVAVRRSAADALLAVYLPVLLFVPDYYRWMAAGLPDPTFSQATLIAITVAWLARGAGWKFSLGDVPVFAFAILVGYSEYSNSGYKDAQNLIFDTLAYMVLPYLLAKTCIEPLGRREPFARRIVFVIFAVSVISAFEFRFGYSPFQRYVGMFFPGQGTGWVTTFRYGLARTAGPFGHCILAGVVVMCGLMMQIWLHSNRKWEPRLRWLKLPKSKTITCGIALGSFMTLARGPWLGGAAAAAVILIGFSRNRRRAAAVAISGVIAVGVPLAVAAWSYASVGRAAAKTASQETAAYRKELIDKYVDIALDHAALGWGRATWPKIAGMPSIDNYYLLLALMHGVIAVAFLLLLLGGTCVRLLRCPEARSAPPGPPLPFPYALAAMQVVVAVSVLTVYMGDALIPFYFFLTGWSEGVITGRPAPAGLSAAPAAQAAQPRYRFAKVIA